MSMTPKVLSAINGQVAAEFSASFAYLGMAAWCEHHQFTGAGHWFRLQSREEHAHAMRLFDFLIARHHPVALGDIAKPNATFGSLLEVFESAQAQEKTVTQQIDALYEMAFNEKVFAAMAELQWFITEQVEEEKNVREIVTKLRMIKDDPSSILDLDRELGARAAEPAAGA